MRDTDVQTSYKINLGLVVNNLTHLILKRMHCTCNQGILNHNHES